MSYILIILTSVIAILGTLIDTKPGLKQKYVFKLTRLRAIIIVALLLVMGISLVNQNDQEKKDRDREIEIGKILHPLFPMEVVSVFTIFLDSLSTEERSKFMQVLDNLAHVNIFDNRFSFPRDFRMLKDTVGEVEVFAGTAGKEDVDLLLQVNNSYLDLRSFILKYIPRYYKLTFLNNAKEYPESIDLEFIVNREKVNYEYWQHSNFITCTWTDTIKYHEVNKSDITNVEEYVKNKDSLILETVGSKFSLSTSFSRLVLHLGDIHYNSYQINPSEDMKKQSKTINDTARVKYKEAFQLISRNFDYDSLYKE